MWVLADMQSCKSWKLINAIVPTWIHRWFGPRYTQQVTEKGSLQYLQPLEGCKHIQVHKIMATQVANQDITVSDFTVIPSMIKTRGQTMLTVHSIPGTLERTHSSVTCGIGRR